MVTISLSMVTKRVDTTVRLSGWLDKEITQFINSSRRNKSEFSSRRALIDRAVMAFLETKGVALESESGKIKSIFGRK